MAGEGTDELCPATEGRNIQRVILRHHHVVQPGCGGGVAAMDRSVLRAVEGYLKLAPGHVLIELGLIVLCVCPLTAADYKQAILGQPSAVNLQDATKLLIEKPHDTVN